MIDSQSGSFKNTPQFNARYATPRLIVLALLSLAIFQGCQPPGPRALLQGERLIRDEKFEQAVEKLKTATELLPQNAQAWNHLGLAYHGAGQPEEAVRAYREAIILDRNLAVARFNLGVLFLEQNQNAEAASELTTFTALQPNSVEGWLNLGTAQLRVRKFDDAEKAFVRVQKIEPGNPEMLDGLGVIQLQRKKPREALNYFMAASKENPKFPPAILNQAIVLQHYLNNRPAALQKYEEYLALKPSSQNLEAVRLTAQNLEAELHPKPIVLNTNIVTTMRTNVQPIPGSNSVAVLRVATNASVPTVHTNVAIKSEPATNPVPTNVLATMPTNKPTKTEPSIAAAKASPPALRIEPEPEVKPEVVLIEDEPPPAPGREIVSPKTFPTTNAVPPTDVAQLPASKTNEALPPLIRPATRESKAGLTEKFNPKNWFRSREASPKASSPIIPPSTQSAAPAIVKTNLPKETIIAAMKPEPVVEPIPVAPRRYRSDAFEIPPEGNRAEAQATLTKGVTAYNDNRLGAAIEAYQDAVRADPAYYDAYYNLALAAYQMHNLPLALSSGERAIRIKPDSADARYNFALTLEESQYPYDAQDQLQEVLSRHPRDARAHFALATLAAETLRNPSLAKEHFRKVLDLEPNHPNAAQIRYWLAAHP